MLQISDPFTICTCKLTLTEMRITFLTRKLQSSSSIGRHRSALIAKRRVVPFQGFLKSVQTSCRMSVPQNSSQREENVASNILRQKKLVPAAEPPSL